jgi:DICT domain-containing protein
VSLAEVVAEAERRRKTMRYYARTEEDLVEQFSVRNVDVEFRELPSMGPEPFVVLVRDDEFLGAMSVETLRWFLSPPVHRPADVSDLSPQYRAIVDLLDETLFASLSRRQLLATTREFEDRARRVGSGTLHVGFQSPRAFEAQRDLYRRLAAETDLDVHVYVQPADASTASTTALSAAGVTVHRDQSAEAGRYWFLVFDGGDGDQQFALVAEERTPDTYYGTWTYDPALVERALAAPMLARGGDESPV